MEKTETIVLLTTLFASRKATDLLRALKILQRNYLPKFENKVVEIFKERYKRNMSWELQVEAIKIIGKQHLVKALPLLEQIVKKNMEHDMVTMEAAAAYFRIVRLNLSDVSPIIKSFGNIGFSIGEGFLNVLGEDNMIPCIEEQELIIQHFWHFGENVEKGILDPKYGLVQACLKWQAPSVSSFIEYCFTIKDPRISSLLKITNKNIPPNNI